MVFFSEGCHSPVDAAREETVEHLSGHSQFEHTINN